MSVPARSRRGARTAFLAGWLAAGAVAGQPPESVRTMLVHLPSAPVESAGRQAEAVTALAEHISRALPAFPLEAKIFRRLQDAQRFLEGNGDTVVLALCDAALVGDLPAGLEPAYRFVLGGRPTYQRVVVVRDDRRELRKLVDLRGRSLAVVETAGAGAGDFLERQVFAGALDPRTWFGTLEPAADDFAATASVLYGQNDAALVAEYNPLLIENLGSGLRIVYESPPLSLPTLSVRAAAFDAEQRDALDEVLRSMGGASPLVAALGLEGLEAVADRRALIASLPAERKRPSLAAPRPGAVTWAELPLPDPADLPFVVAIELPDVAIDPADLTGENGSR